MAERIYDEVEPGRMYWDKSRILEVLTAGRSLLELLEQGNDVRPAVRQWLIGHAEVIGQHDMAKFRLELFENLDTHEILVIVERLRSLIETSFTLSIRLTATDDNDAAAWESLNGK